MINEKKDVYVTMMARQTLRAACSKSATKDVISNNYLPSHTHTNPAYRLIKSSLLTIYCLKSADC